MKRTTRQRTYPSTARDGRAAAEGTAFGIKSPKWYDELGQFRELDTDDARSAFAGRFLELLGPRLDETWRFLYEILKLVEDRKLYRKLYNFRPRPRGQAGEYPHECYESFQQFWDAKVKLPFARWKELEDTHHYCERFAPWLFERPFDEAKRTAAQEIKRRAAENTTGDVLPEGRPAAERTKLVRSLGERATSNGVSKAQQQKLDALARRAPALLEQVKAGELSTHRACIQAGIVKVPSPLDKAKKAFTMLNKAQRQQFERWMQEQAGKRSQ
jgi:hypothetical protein